MRRRAAPLLLGLVLTAGAAGAAELKGRVDLGLPDARLADLGPTVVYLEPLAGPASPTPGRATIRQHNARFEPDFLVIPAGHSVAMPNDDTIFHNVFSFSRPNEFDLGLYPAGSSRSVTFRHPGLVKIYCSIHESMSGTVLVVPTPHFARVAAGGGYRISGVPAGRYRLTVWNEKLPPLQREVSLSGSRVRRVDLMLGGAAVGKQAP